MRILMTTDTVGGVWTFTQELASGLLEQGCDIALVSLGLPNRDQCAWCSEMEGRWSATFCFRAADVPLEWMQENERAFVEAAPLLLRVADEFKPDVLHSNQFCFGALPLAIPRIVTAHSDVLSWAAYCLKVPLEDTPWLKQYCLLVSAGLDGADAVVAPTAWMLNVLSRTFHLPEKQLVIPNGQKIDETSQRRRKLQAVTAGRLWDEAKNIAMLSEIQSQSPLPLLVAGQTSFQQKNMPPAGEMISFLGALSRSELLALFRESAIYICTSQYEPFGLAPLEAALCGCAVLVNDIPSLREIWGDAALYFSDADALLRLLHTLSSNSKILLRAQSRSIARAKRYTREEMASAYLSTYRRLVVEKKDLLNVA